MSIQTVINASRHAPKGTLDRKVYLSNIIDRFSYHNAVCVYVDVPIDNVVALNRQPGIWDNGETWRQAVRHLIGEGWDAKAIAYFDTPLLERKFPPPGSSQPLKLSIIGGACYCSCGNHRLVAGMALLANKVPKQQFLLQAKAYYYALDSDTRDFLKSAADEGADVNTARISNSEYVYGEVFDIVLCRTDEPHTYYARGEKGIRKIVSANRFQRLFNLKAEPPGAHNWCLTPNEVIQRILDDEWITRQLPHACTW